MRKKYDELKRMFLSRQPVINSPAFLVSTKLRTRSVVEMMFVLPDAFSERCRMNVLLQKKSVLFTLESDDKRESIVVSSSPSQQE